MIHLVPPVGIADVRAAAARISPYIRRTPLLAAEPVRGGAAGRSLTLKLDTTHEFNTQAAAFRLTPSVDSADGTPTLAVPEPAPESTITWALNNDAIQDFEEPTGLVNYLMDNALDRLTRT